MTYERRFYREWVRSQDLVNFQVSAGETDLYVSAERDLTEEAGALVLKYRKDIEDYIKTDPLFEPALVPIEARGDAPEIVKEMAQAGKIAGVGPMAAVAGAVAEFVGRDLLRHTGQVIIENGGDIYIRSLKARRVGIYAGRSPLTGRLAIEIISEKTPLGVCTSSGSIGHSLSFGVADAAIILSRSTTLADAVATAACNRVKSADDVERAVDFAKSIEGVDGAVIIAGDRVGVWGDVCLTRLR